MKKEAIIVKCDGNGCNVTAEILDKTTFPEHWYRIHQVDGAGRTVPNLGFDLCSLRCIERWAKGRRQANPESHEYICDVPGCDMTFDTMQGVSLHKHRAHGG